MHHTEDGCIISSIFVSKYLLMKPKNKKHPQPYNAAFFNGVSKQTLYGLLAVLLTTLLLFSGGLKNEILVGWDDGVYLENNDVRNLSVGSVVDIFSSFHLGMYQPLPVVTFAINYALHGESAMGYHLVNLLMHLINCVLVFVLIRKLYPGDLSALFVALLFAIHPMHVEGVSWIATRSNGVYSLFYLLAANYYLHYLDSGNRKRYLLLTGLFFVLSLFSKSMAMSFPLLMLLMDYYRKRKFDRAALLEKLPFFAVSLIFGLVAIRGAASFGHIESLNVGYNLFDRLLMITWSLWFYLWKMIVPLNLSAIYTFPALDDGLLPFSYYMSLPIIAAIVFLLWRFRKTSRDWIFGLGLFVIVLAPVLPFFWSRVFIVAERYTYLSYVGLFFLLALLIEKGLRLSRQSKFLPPSIIYAIVAIWLVVLAGTTFNQTRKWVNTETLLKDVITTNNSTTDVAAAYFYLANLYESQNDPEPAMEAYTLAIQKNPEHFLAYNNRGILLGSLGYFEEALVDFNTVLKLKPDYAEGWYNRGILLYQAGRNNEACNDWRRAAKLGAAHAEDAYRRYCQ
jgi:protein O-mannosyl-transferase